MALLAENLNLKWKCLLNPLILSLDKLYISGWCFFREPDGNCLLNTLNVALATGSLISAPSYGYYEAKEGTRGCSSMYSCSNNACIDLNKVCDGTYDCLDGGDESNCTSAQATFQLGLTGGRTANEGLLQVTGKLWIKLGPFVTFMLHSLITS